MPNAWVNHIKRFAAANNMSYGCALSDPRCKASYRAQPARPTRPPSPPKPTSQPVKAAISEKAQMKKADRMGSKAEINRGNLKFMAEMLQGMRKKNPNWRAMDIAANNLKEYTVGPNEVPGIYYNRAKGRHMRYEDKRPIEVQQKEAELLNIISEEFERNERMLKKGIKTSTNPQVWDKNAKLYAGMGRYKKRCKT